MSEKRIELKAGDTLVVTGIPAGTESPQEPTPTGQLEILLVIGSVNIYQSIDGSYVMFKSNLDICNDGSGPAHGDPYHQAQTAYYNGGKFLNADTDRYIVIPPQVRSMTAGVVMGCQAKLTNLITNQATDAVTGDIGPSNKTGEASYCAAKAVNPTITYNSGDQAYNYLYELWPNKPATVNGKTYKLEPV